ncbi:putative minor histocompatibility protein HA-1, partial [Scophthalmus maximus]
MCDSGRRRKTDRQFKWLKVGVDGTEVPLSRATKWRVGGWVGGLYVKLREVGMDGKGTLKMFTRKKRELIKTPSISKKSRAGSPGSQSSASSNGDRAVRGRSVMKRSGKGSYNPYSTSQRVKKGELKAGDRLDILPNKHNVWLKQVLSLRGSMCDSGRRRKTDRQFKWLKVGVDGTEVPLSRATKWRVGGWVGGLYVKLREVGMDGKGTLKMFTRKKRELIKTPSISKKSRAGSPGSQSSASSV